MQVLYEGRREQRLMTGLLYVEPTVQPFDEQLAMIDEPLATLPLERVRPARAVLDEVMEQLRTGRA
jgi:2-oxoglutarate ferredoxin oxidoreductase subunit beta